MPHLSQLEAFLEAAACGNFTTASERLSLSPSAVSARIKALEAEIGARLFERSKRGVVLNEAGRSLLTHAETTVRAWEQGCASVRTTIAGNVPIRVGVQPDLWGVFAAPWYSRLRHDAPEVQLRLTSDYSDVLCGLVAEGLLDFAITLEPSRRRGIVLERLVTLPLILAASRPARWDGSLPSDYCYVDWGRRFALWHEETFASEPAHALTVNASGLALHAINESGGAAYVLAPTVRAATADGHLYAIDGAPEFPMDIWTARSGSTPEHRPIDFLLETVKAVGARDRNGLVR